MKLKAKMKSQTLVISKPQNKKEMITPSLYKDFTHMTSVLEIYCQYVKFEQSMKTRIWHNYTVNGNYNIYAQRCRKNAIILL